MRRRRVEGLGRIYTDDNQSWASAGSKFGRHRHQRLERLIRQLKKSGDIHYNVTGDPDDTTATKVEWSDLETRMRRQPKHPATVPALPTLANSIREAHMACIEAAMKSVEEARR